MGRSSTNSISSAKDNVNSDVIFRINSNSLSVFGLSKGERVSIYDTTGRLITTAISTKDNETLNLSLKTSMVFILHEQSLAFLLNLLYRFYTFYYYQININKAI